MANVDISNDLDGAGHGIFEVEYLKNCVLQTLAHRWETIYLTYMEWYVW